MTREEAKEFIAQSVKSDVDMALVADAINAIEKEPNIRNCFGCKYSKDNHNQAIEECHLCMWENQYTPTTKNDLVVDAVSRKAVITIIQNHWWNCRDIDKLVNELPSITPQECKVGKWIFVEGIRGKDNVEKCSCCGSHWKEAIIYRTDTQEYLRTRLLYCPNCGSRNEVEE